MKRASVFTVVLAAAMFMAHPSAQTAKPAAGAGQGRLIEIQATEQMKFSVTAITAKPGELIHVRLKAIGTMPKMAMSHNFVLLKKGADASAFANASMMAAKTAYIPADKASEVIAHTAVVGGGETADVTFKAPAAGTYTFLCSFPGHFAAGMKGTLTVK
jgi:azurin